MSGGVVWTKDTYNPPNSTSTTDRQICAAFVPSGISCSNSGTHRTKQPDYTPPDYQDL